LVSSSQNGSQISDLNILNIVAAGYKIGFEKAPLKALKTKNHK